MNDADQTGQMGRLICTFVVDIQKYQEIKLTFTVGGHYFVLLILLKTGTVKLCHSQKDHKLVFKTNYRLMQVKSIAECSKGSILQFF